VRHTPGRHAKPTLEAGLSSLIGGRRNNVKFLLGNQIKPDSHVRLALAIYNQRPFIANKRVRERKKKYIAVDVGLCIIYETIS
jgi:hypothetical protein